MNIEKIKNYNQKMLAALVTIVVAAAGIGLISLIVLLVSELIPNKVPAANTLLSDEQVEELKKDSLRQQIISFGTPVLVDTLMLKYIVPVHVKTLNEPENLDEGVLGLMDTSDGSSISRAKTYNASAYFGAFNNLVVYAAKTNVSLKVSSTRLVGSDLAYAYFDDEIIVTFSGAEKDSNKDKLVNMADFQSLFIFSLNNYQLKRIGVSNSTVTSFKYVENEKDMLITFGYDRNKDNKFDSRIEPTFVMKYDYDKELLTPIISKGLENEIQSIIDLN
ncbi:MAG: hypothetical protein ACK5JD_05935 [Mangrovibacterium sp.]